MPIFACSCDTVKFIVISLGTFHGAIAVPSVTRCRCSCHRRRRRRCRGYRCARATVATPVNGRAAARSGEWAQHFSNASCCCSDLDDGNHGSHLDRYLAAAVVGAASSDKSKINSISRFTLCFKSHLAEYQVPAHNCTR